MATNDLKNVFNRWGQHAKGKFSDKQWLLSKWELFEGIKWSKSKKDIMIETIRQGLLLDRNNHLIDIGCGGGWIASQLQVFVKKIKALDFSETMLSIAKKQAPQAELVCAEAGKLPFKDESFDRVLSYYVFLNFSDDAYVFKSLSEIYRVLKTGGRALIGQLPKKEGSKAYDLAKAEYFIYCQKKFTLGNSIRDIEAPPLRLFEQKQIIGFLEKNNIRYELKDSFNSFYREGEPHRISWRFDLILKK